MAAFSALGSACAPSPQESGEVAPPQLGILLTTYKSGTLEECLGYAKDQGLACVQVAMSNVGLEELPDEIPADIPGRIRREAANRGLSIASVQGLFNMCHPDAAQRELGLRRLRVLAGVCAEIGTSSVHICTGTRNTESMWRRHPDNNTPEAWRDSVACIRKATEIAREANVVLAFEPEVNNVVDSALKSRRLMDEIGSPHLKVTFDPANIFHAGDLPRMTEVLEEAFELVGDDIQLAHAKDLDRDGDAGHKAAGEGLLDYDLYMRLLQKHRFSGPLLLHGLTREQVPGCVAFLRAKLAGVAG